VRIRLESWGLQAESGGLFFLSANPKKSHQPGPRWYPEAFHGATLAAGVPGVEAVQIAEHQLQGGYENRHDHRHAEHDPGVRCVKPAPEVEGTDSRDDKGVVR